MKNTTKTAILAALPLLGAVACDPAPASFGGGTWGSVIGDEGKAAGDSAVLLEEPAPTYGELRVAMSAEPSDEIKELWVRFDQVRARSEAEGWVVVSDDDVTIDLLALGGGLEEELGLDEVPTGRYGGLSLHTRDAWAVVGGERIPVEIPGTDRGGLTIPFTFTVPECATMDVVLHWDVARALRVSRLYRLEPIVRVRSAEYSGECGASGGGGTGGTEGSSGGESSGGGSDDIGIQI